MGTPLEGTHLPMRTWFTGLSLLAVSSKGLSSVALGRHLGIGQKTAWFLGHRIRAMMADDTGLLRGIVEADETYVGGKRKRGQKSKQAGDAISPREGRQPQGHDCHCRRARRQGPCQAGRDALGTNDRHFPIHESQ